MRKTILLAAIAIAVGFTACKKDEPAETPNPTQQDVSFSAVLVDPGSEKEWECVVDDNGNLLEPDYACVTIDGIDYYPQVYRIDGILYTQNIKLDVIEEDGTQDYTVSKFLLYDDNGTEGDMNDDQIVMGTPMAGSDYAVYVTKDLNFDITVTAFQKAQVDVEVLCFQEDVYTKFGFDWFTITEIVIREQCFFGDICVKHPEAYVGSNYENQSTGLQLDMPAIMELHVFDENGDPVPGSPFTNNLPEVDFGVGAPLCIQYPDNLQVAGETFTVELHILVKWGDTFVFEHFHTWTFDDAETIEDGDDGIVEIVLGACNLTDTDLQLNPYQDLPTMAFIDIHNPGATTYWDINVISMTPPGSYDMFLGHNIGFCADINTTISNNISFDAYVYPSLYDNDWPAGMPFDLESLAKVNWIFNNLDNWGYSMTTIDEPFGTDLQDAIWCLLNGEPTCNYLSTAAQSHGDYVPLPGGWAAVCFVKDDQPLNYQVLITIVDP